MTHSAFAAVFARDLRLALRRRVEALLPVVFFVVAVSLFPLGVGPEPQTLRQIAAGVVWVCALLASMLSVSALYALDFHDGSLEQMMISGHPGTVIAAAKATAHWTITGAPLVVAAPVIGLLLDMQTQTLVTLVASLLLGTPILSLLGGLGAALTLGLRSSGVLLILLILPLAVPALIFGAGAVSAFDAGTAVSGHFSLLGALLIVTALTAPVATAYALRIALE
ncbi:MAG: heme exporter protein CcmB [Burkholderiaceae bacterium]